MHDGNTKKTCVTRCFTVKEHGGENRRYIYMIDPTRKETCHATLLTQRVKWMEALELCSQPELQYVDESGHTLTVTSKPEPNAKPNPT